MRIIAGAFKGRRLLGPVGKAVTRPITGAARKSVFDILAGRLDDAVVLDLYCGTGTLGLEALSRGAARCCFAERDRAAISSLRRNISAVGAEDRSEIWAGDIPSRLAEWLAGLNNDVNIAFVDPPYAESQRWDWAKVEQGVFRPLAARLAGNGLVVLRTEGRLAVPDELGRLRVLKSRKYGGMLVTMYGRADR